MELCVFDTTKRAERISLRKGSISLTIRPSIIFIAFSWRLLHTLRIWCVQNFKKETLMGISFQQLITSPINRLSIHWNGSCAISPQQDRTNSLVRKNPPPQQVPRCLDSRFLQYFSTIQNSRMPNELTSIQSL